MRHFTKAIGFTSLFLALGAPLLAGCGSEGRSDTSGDGGGRAAGDGTGTGGSGINGAGTAGSGTGGAPTLLEGATCKLGDHFDCPHCTCDLGNFACLQSCGCNTATTYGVICNGTCSEKCVYHDEDNPACANAIAAPVEGKPGSCSVEATVEGRLYVATATEYPNSTGEPEHGDCKRVMPGGGNYSVSGGAAPGRPCDGTCPTACEAALSDFKSNCCGK